MSTNTVTTAAIAASNLPFRPFNDSDWFGFSGAEDFADGTLPHIADIDAGPNTVTVVLSGNGADIVVHAKDSDFMMAYTGTLEQGLALRLPLTIDQVIGWQQC